MQSKSIKGKSLSALKTALDDEISADFRATLAVVFCSVTQDLKRICEYIDQKGLLIFGCTTHGEFINEDTLKGYWTILLLDIPREYFEVYLEEYPKRNYREVAFSIANKAKTKFDKPAFLVGFSHVEANGEDILNGLEDAAGKEVNVFGGAAGDDYAFKKTFVFTNQMISDRGVICLALDETKVEVKGIATCGWKAIGTEKTVTKSEGNHVYTIEGVPVLDLFEKYGGLSNVTPDNENLFVELACNLPLQLQREKGSPVMRGGIVIDWSDRSFYTSGTVPQGSKVRFSVPPDWDVMDKVVQDLNHLKATEMPESDAVIVFSCAGRILSLGPLMSEEIKGIDEVWNVPMVGMFSNGELGRTRGGNLELLNLTTCCVALKEKV